MDVAAMLDEDYSSWNELVQILDKHPDVVVHRADSEWQWRSQDVYCHLSRWMNFSMDCLAAELASTPPPPEPEGTEDEINRRWELEDRDVSFDEARRRAHEAFERRVRLIKSVPGDGWNAKLEELARIDGEEHYRQHLSYIQDRA